MNKKHGPIWLIVVFALVSFGQANASEAEQYFKDAAKYTVKITTQVQIAFIGDEKGSFTGTGFLIDKSKGWILTNAHVTSRSKSVVKVSFKDQKQVRAEKVYIDPLLDIAVIKVPLSSLPKTSIAAPLECRDEVSLGHPVGAYGHPWSLNYTATRGIVSGRTFKSGEHWLQTDAPINSGNSGGPLISLLSGKVVGISSASLNKREAQRLNFAVPMRYACKIVSILKEGDNPSPPNLQLRFFKYEEDNKPLKVAAVYASKPQYPIKSGDVIENVVGHKNAIHNPTTLIHLLRGEYKNGARLRVKRAGKTIIISLPAKPMKKVTQRKGIHLSGLVIAHSDLIDDSEFNLGKSIGIHSIEDGSTADAKDIRRYDMLDKVNGVHYESLEKLYATLKKLKKSGKPVHLQIKRFVFEDSGLYGYREIELPIDELKLL